MTDNAMVTVQLPFSVIFAQDRAFRAPRLSSLARCKRALATLDVVEGGLV